jgi:hypothetical protein
MGDVMANAFQTLSTIWSQTHFPYFCPPNNNNPIFFALLGTNQSPILSSTHSYEELEERGHPRGFEMGGEIYRMFPVDCRKETLGPKTCK